MPMSVKSASCTTTADDDGKGAAIMAMTMVTDDWSCR